MKVSSAQFLKEYGRLSDHALTEPVTITRNGRDRLVLVSNAMFEDLRRAAVRSRKSEELEDWEVAAIARAEVPPEYDHLDRLLDEPHA